MNRFAVYLVPTLILLIAAYGVYKKINVFEAFVEGASDGLKIVAKILPVLIGLILVVSALKSSGIIDMILAFVKPVTTLLGVPEEILPLALLRPVSGSASLALLSELFKQTGADSQASKMGSTLLASTETTLYTIALYFGTVKVKKYRYTVAAALLCDLTAIICSIVFVKVLRI